MLPTMASPLLMPIPINVQRGLTTTVASGVEGGSSALHIEGRLHGPLGVRWLRQGRPKQGEETITEEFIERALVLE